VDPVDPSLEPEPFFPRFPLLLVPLELPELSELLPDDPLPMDPLPDEPLPEPD
jgi:hypothetical protein